jgi:hypothetical protein
LSRYKSNDCARFGDAGAVQDKVGVNETFVDALRGAVSVAHVVVTGFAVVKVIFVIGTAIGPHAFLGTTLHVYCVLHNNGADTGTK